MKSADSPDVGVQVSYIKNILKFTSKPKYQAQPIDRSAKKNKLQFQNLQ